MAPADRGVTIDVLLVNQQCKQCIDARQYQTQKIRDGYSDLELWTLFIEAMHGHGKEYLREHEKNLTLAVRRLFKGSEERFVSSGSQKVDRSDNFSGDNGSNSEGQIPSHRTAVKPIDLKSPIFR